VLSYVFHSIPSRSGSSLLEILFILRHMSRRYFLTLCLFVGTFILFSTPTLSHTTDYSDPSRRRLRTTTTKYVVADLIPPKSALSLGRHAISVTGGAKRGFPMGSGVASGSRSRLGTLRSTLFPIFGRQEVTKFLLIGSIKFFVILALTLTRDTKGSFLQDNAASWMEACCTIPQRRDSLLLLFL
jgi:hypothetical protein